MSMARRALRKLERIAHCSLRTRGELAQMKRSSDSRVREVALAIEATLHHEIGASEAKAIDEIEALRTELWPRSYRQTEPTRSGICAAPRARLPCGLYCYSRSSVRVGPSVASSLELASESPPPIKPLR